MPGPDQLRLLAPLAAALAALLVAGVAALVHLAVQRAPAPWRLQLIQRALASPWNGRDLIFLLAVFAAAQLLQPRTGGTMNWLAFPLLAAGLLWRARAKPQPFGAARPLRTITIQAGLRWLAVLPVLWFTAFVWQLALQAAGQVPEFQMAIRLFLETRGWGARAGFLLYAVALAPVVEEILFRGILLPVLVRRTGATAGIALVALGFAALHADAGSFAALAVFSGALSLAYVRSGTLWVPVLMHALFNGVNLALLLALLRTGLV
jgi:membrane protease YdiL (CAAX protease family)